MTSKLVAVPTEALRVQLAESLASMNIVEMDGVAGWGLKIGGTNHAYVARQTDALPSPDDAMDAFIRLFMPTAQPYATDRDRQSNFIVWRTRPEVTVTGLGESYRAHGRFYLTRDGAVAREMVDAAKRNTTGN